MFRKPPLSWDMNEVHLREMMSCVKGQFPLVVGQEMRSALLFVQGEGVKFISWNTIFCVALLFF